MSVQHLLWLYLWIAPHVLLLAVSISMFRRGLHKEFPIFLSYVFFEILMFSVLFAIFCHGGPAPLYARLDVFYRVGAVALWFGVLQELFERPFAESGPLRQSLAPLRKAVTALIVILVSGSVGILCYRAWDRWAVSANWIPETVNAAQAILIALLLLWHRFLGQRMSPFAFGIAAGLGLVTGLELLAWALSGLGPAYWLASDVVSLGSYHVAVLIWLFFAYAKEAAPLEPQAARLLAVEKWAADLRRTTQL